MAFNPDEYLKKKQNSGSFDPDKYLASMQETETNSLPGYLESGLRGASQGASFGFSDEILAGLGAGKDVVTGDVQFANIVDAYRKRHEEEQAANKAAEEANPSISTMGNLVGSLAPLLLTGGASAPATAAAETATIARLAAAAKAGATGAGIAKAGLTGAGIGALTGLGTSEADLTKGDIGGAATDATLGAIGGGVLGAGLHGGMALAKGVKNLGKSTAKYVGDTDLLIDIKKGYKYGTESVDLGSKAGAEAAAKGAQDVSGDVGFALKDSMEKRIGPELARAKQAVVDAGGKVDSMDELNVLKSFVEKNKYSIDDEISEDVKKISKYLDQLENGKIQELTVPVTTIPKEITLPAVPGAKAELEKEIPKLQALDEINRVNAKYHIQESSDKKYLSIVRVLDEQTGSPERMAKVINKEGTPVLNKKGEVKLNKNGEPIVKGKGKPILDEEGNAIEEMVVDENLSKYKSSATPVKTVENVSEVPAQNVFDSPATTADQKVNVRIGGGIKGTFNEANEINSALNNLTGLGESKLKSNEARLAVTDVASKINEKRLNPLLPDSANPEIVPQFQAANKKARNLYQAFEVLGLDKNADFWVNNGKVDIKPDAVIKMMNKIKNLETGTAASDNHKIVMDSVLGFLKEADPEVVKLLEPKIKRAAEIYDLTKKAQRLNVANRSTFLKAGSIKAANELGKAVAWARPKIPNLTAATPEGMRDIMTHLSSTGAKGQKLAMELSQGLKKDNVGRNAALFAISQNPEYRKMLSEYVEQDNKDVTK